MSTSIILTILILGLIILIHEFGHFITARLFKVPVSEFAVGLGPNLFSIKGKETKYSLKAFPVGGFVSIDGMELDSDSEDGFNTRGKIPRLFILSAGIIMNFLLAFVIIGSIFFFRGHTVTDKNTTEIGLVFPEVKAANVLMVGDDINSIAGKEVAIWSDISGVLKGLPNDSEKVVIELTRAGEKLELEVPLTKVEERLLLGIEPHYEVVKYDSFAKLLGDTSTFVISIIAGIFSFIGELIRGDIHSSSVSGPIGMVGIVENASQGGFSSLLFLTALLSINIGVFNLLPFPALDGGRILFIAFESVGIKVNKRIEERLHFLGALILFSLIIYVTIQDLTKI